MEKSKAEQYRNMRGNARVPDGRAAEAFGLRADRMIEDGERLPAPCSPDAMIAELETLEAIAGLVRRPIHGPCE